jgi:hypothetical protein
MSLLVVYRASERVFGEQAGLYKPVDCLAVWPEISSGPPSLLDCPPNGHLVGSIGSCRPATVDRLEILRTCCDSRLRVRRMSHQTPGRSIGTQRLIEMDGKKVETFTAGTIISGNQPARSKNAAGTEVAPTQSLGVFVAACRVLGADRQGCSLRHFLPSPQQL